MWAGVADAARRMKVFIRTYRKRIDLLNGKLTILFLNGALPNTVPLIFGESFTAVLYDGVAIDPGSPKMRRSLARHLDQLKPRVSTIVATHAHEEHVGNLNWLSERTGAPVCVSEMTARFLTPFKKLPFVSRSRDWPTAESAASISNPARHGRHKFRSATGHSIARTL